MKLNIVLVFLFAAIAFSCGQNNEVNKKISWIYDYEEILTKSQERYLNSIISDYEKKSTNEIMIVTSKDIGEFETAIQYAADFGSTREVGKNGKDNGLVIFVSKNLSETALSTGYGTDKTFKDEICKKIVDSCMIPLFREEKYFDGIKVGIDECIKEWK